MRLTPEEVKNIDTALEALKRSLKDELQRFAGQPNIERLDDRFLANIADSYFSAAGILCLLQDAHFLRDECGGPCHITCVTPGKVACGTGSL
jgi:hypothetical protein